jgi:ribosome-associated protein
MLCLTEVVSLDERDIHERFVRAIGARGQNARKEATAVELRLDLEASSLPDDVKARLRVLAGRAVTRDGVLLMVSRVQRSQAENREAALARLLALVLRAATPPAARRPMRPRIAVGRNRRAAKEQRGEVNNVRCAKETRWPKAKSQ